MELLMFAGNSRLAFLHHCPPNGHQIRTFVRPTYCKTHMAWANYPFRKKLLLAALPAHSNAEISPNDISKEDDKSALTEAVDDPESHLLSAEKLNALLMDAERTRLVKKLSEANQYNRFFKRQLQLHDDDLENFKSELAVIEAKLQGLVGLAEELANLESPPSTRQVNGEYIQAHLLSGLNAIHKKLNQQIEGFDRIKHQEVTLSWVGMAECVQVMGSFDGWSQGEEMSPEYDGGYNKFSVALKLRPGRYEVKFLVDGQWRLSPELPTVGEGVMQNNILVV